MFSEGHAGKDDDPAPSDAAGGENCLLHVADRCVGGLTVERRPLLVQLAKAALVDSQGSTRIEAIWAAAHATWWTVDHGLVLDWSDVLERIQEPLR